MRPPWSIVGPNLIWLMSLKKRRNLDTHTRRMPCDWRWRQRSGRCFYEPKEGRDSQQPPGLELSLPHSPLREPTLQTHWSGISVFQKWNFYWLYHPVRGTLYATLGNSCTPIHLRPSFNVPSPCLCFPVPPEAVTCIALYCSDFVCVSVLPWKLRFREWSTSLLYLCVYTCPKSVHCGL